MCDSVFLSHSECLCCCCFVGGSGDAVTLPYGPTASCEEVLQRYPTAPLPPPASSSGPLLSVPLRLPGPVTSKAARQEVATALQLPATNLGQVLMWVLPCMEMPLATAARAHLQQHVLLSIALWSSPVEVIADCVAAGHTDPRGTAAATAAPLLAWARSDAGLAVISGALKAGVVCIDGQGVCVEELMNGQAPRAALGVAFREALAAVVASLAP